MWIKKTYIIPIYDFPLTLIITDNLKKFNKLLRKMGIEEEDYVYAHAIHTDKFYIILNPNYKHKKLTSGIIAHEAYHITDYIFKHIGAGNDGKSNEAFAYLLTWIVDTVTNNLKKLRIRI